MKNIALLTPAAFVAALGCSDSGSTDVPENTAQAITTYSQIVLASYQDSLAAAQAMDTTIQAFTAAPTAATLSAAKTAWITSREPYLQTEVYRFYDGPIDNPTDGPEGLMNAWPLDESYIDYVEGNATAGIVNGPRFGRARFCSGLWTERAAGRPTQLPDHARLPPDPLIV